MKLLNIPPTLNVGVNDKGEQMVLDFATFLGSMLKNASGNLDVMRLVASLADKSWLPETQVELSEAEHGLMAQLATAPNNRFAASLALAIVIFSDAVLSAQDAPETISVPAPDASPVPPQNAS